MTLLSVKHLTRYAYGKPVRLGEHRLMVRPRDSFDQRLSAFNLQIDPEPKRIHWLHDAFGNCIAVVDFIGETTELTFDVEILVEHESSLAPDFSLEPYATFYPFAYSAEDIPDLTRCIERQFLDPDHQVDAWVRRFLRKGRPTETGELLMTVTAAIKESFVYARRTERGTQDPVTTLMSGRGSCRDFAMLMMEAVRALGLAARFVSGYLHVASDAAADVHGGGNTHAWCQVYLPGAGWVEFDPTNGIVGSRNLIRVAVARDPRQALPLHGSYYGAAADSLGMTVSVRTHEIARIEAPLPLAAPIGI